MALTKKKFVKIPEKDLKRAFEALCRHCSEEGKYFFSEGFREGEIGGRPKICKGIDPGFRYFEPKEMYLKDGPRGGTEIVVYGNYDTGTADRLILEEGRVEPSPFLQIFESASPLFRQSLAAALDLDLSLEHPEGRNVARNLKKKIVKTI